MKIMNNNEKLAKIAVHKSLLKEYSNSSDERIVYMDNGTEFQIQIFNPYSYTIGAIVNVSSTVPFVTFIISPAVNVVAVNDNILSVGVIDSIGVSFSPVGFTYKENWSVWLV